jgi:hypothetical protein
LNHFSMSLLTDQLKNGVVPANLLTRALGVSPATLMRRVRAERGNVVAFGRGRATRYGLRREVKGLEPDIPILRIDAMGKPDSVGQLVILAADENAWLPAGVVFKRLPPEIADMQPSGYMGRAFPRQHGHLALPPRIADWSNDHVLIALARRGDDFTGNLILGSESVERWFATRPIAVARDDYPRLAEAATAGEPPGSSAGGERPKFGAYVEGRHVIVKFATGGDPAAQRWKELLNLEALALEVLRDGGVAAVDATILETGTQTFLEVPRFDRIGERGRRAVMSLAAAYQDPSVSWSRAAASLEARGLLSPEDSRRLRLNDAFARLIANEDRHHHNVCVFPEHRGAGESAGAEPARYELAPAFDQLPTLYAPTTDGHIPERAFVAPTPSADTWEVWGEAVRLAATFWRRAGALESLSPGMKVIALRNFEALDRMPTYELRKR